MFLINIARRARRDDAGSTILAVIGLIAVTAVIGVTVTTVTVSGLASTTSARASVQARAAAEAGVDKALVALETTCTTSASSTTAPKYSYQIYYALSSTSPTWVLGCPTDTAELIKIISTGSARDRGAAGVSAGDTQVVEAVYANIPLYVEVPQVEPAVYAHTMEGIFRNFVLSSASASIAADVQIRNGNVICENGATIDGSVILANGYVQLNRCNVNGDVHVSKSVEVGGTGTVVRGDILALGDGVATGSNAVWLKGGIGEVEGSVYSSKNILVEDQVRGDVTLSGTPSSALRVSGSSARVYGDVVSSGSAAVTGVVDGTVSQNFSGLAPLPAPRVPDWTDIGYPSTAWDGYTVVPWQGSCSIGNSHVFWEGLATRTAISGKLVVDARSCGAAGLDFQNNIRPLVLNANVSFIAWKFVVDKLVVSSNNSQTRYLWFMVPDNTADGQPTCSSPAGTITLTNEADIQPTISAFAYTPCKIISDRNNWRGQLYGGTMQFLQQAQLTYVPVGVPGVDFDASLPPILVLNDSKLGTRVSFRELVGG